MTKTKRILCGIIMVALAVVIILNLTNVLQFNLMFDGWWTVFIIVPCLFGLIFDRDKMGPLFGIGVGAILLLCAQSYIAWGDLWKFLIALFALIWGLSMIFGSHHGFRKGDNMETLRQIKQLDREGLKISDIDVHFSGRKASFHGERFEGANVKLAFGALGLDLRGADLMDGAVLHIDCSFAGMEILLDEAVVVKNGMNCAFGGVEEKRRYSTTDAKTIYLEGNCSFAGIEIK